MAHGMTHQGTFADEVTHLGEEVAELGILAMEAFKNVAATLFEPEPLVADSAVQAALSSTLAAQSIHQSAIAILARWAPRNADLARLMRLQRTATAYAQIADHSRRAVEQTMSADRTFEHELQLTQHQAPDLLAGLVRQVYVALRGSLVVTTTQNRAIARRLIVEDAELDRLYKTLHAMLERAVDRQPHRAVTLHRLEAVLAQMRQIGGQVVAICENWL
jgi:hypothetical protein